MSSKSVLNVYQNTRILEEYRDRCYVNNVLCQLSSDYYGKLKMILSIPLIILSSVMTILNSSELNSASSSDSMRKGTQILNIILNTFTIILISLGNTLKYSEKEGNFRTLAVKYNKLCHVFEDNLVYSASKISHSTIFELITEYDNLNETLEYSFPEHIKTRVKKLYKDRRTLPNILNCEKDFVKSIEKLDELEGVAVDANKTFAERYKTANIESSMGSNKTPRRFSREIQEDKRFVKSLKISNGTNKSNNTNCAIGTNGYDTRQKLNQMYNINKKPSPKISYCDTISDTRSMTSPYLNKCESPYVKHYRRRKTSIIATEEVYNTDDDDDTVYTKKLEPIYTVDDLYLYDKSDKNIAINITDTPPVQIVGNTILRKNSSLDNKTSMSIMGETDNKNTNCSDSV